MRYIGISLLILCTLGLAACAGTAPAPVNAPAASPTVPATTAARTPLPLPAQPTSPPIAPRNPTPFPSATYASIVTSAPQVVATSAPAATATRAPQTASPVAAAQPPSASAPGVATGVRSETKLEFVSQLTTAEETDDLRLTLMRIPGILAVSGNETAITVVYDAGLILPDQIKARLASMGHPIKP